MKALRISASIFALAALSALAACGGGGGGGGGGTPPTSAPTGHPTSTPTTGPTSTPTTSPTATPTSGSVLVNTAHTVNAGLNVVNGAQGWYTSGTASWSNNAGDDSSSTAPTTTGATFDGMTCANTVEGTSYPSTAYSQHAFVGIFNSSGLEMALPQALGMVNPVAPTAGNPAHPNNNYEVENNQCEYNQHTHDYSGLVHMEDINSAQTASYTFAQPWATLGSLLDLWGATLNSASGLTAGGSSIAGAVTIYTGTPSTTVGGADLVTSYTQYTGDPRALVFTRHEAVWIVIGTTAANLPPNGFGTSNGLPQVKFSLVN